MRRPGGLCRQEGDRKSLPSQSSPQWRREEVVGTGEGSGTARKGAALSPAEPAPDIESCSLTGGPPGQTPDALSPSAAPRSQPPALLSPPPVCQSPATRGQRVKPCEIGKRQDKTQVGETKNEMQNNDKG